MGHPPARIQPRAVAITTPSFPRRQAFAPCPSRAPPSLLRRLGVGPRRRSHTRRAPRARPPAKPLSGCGAPCSWPRLHRRGEGRRSPLETPARTAARTLSSALRRDGSRSPARLGTQTSSGWRRPGVSGGQARPALGPTPGQDAPTAPGLHAQTKPVRLLPFAIVRLIRSFHAASTRLIWATTPEVKVEAVRVYRLPGWRRSDEKRASRTPSSLGNGRERRVIIRRASGHARHSFPLVRSSPVSTTVENACGY